MIKMISDLIPYWASIDPGRIAFRDHAGEISFEDAARKTAQVAHVLAAAGLMPGERVAICMPSSVLTGLAVHGVLRAGGAFVPVDPEAPPERIQQILSDCGVRYVLATPLVRDVLKAALTGFATVFTVGLDETSWDDVWSAPPIAPENAADPERLAYIMYTSGSTGVPKGIKHCHRSGLAYAKCSTEVYNVAPSDVVSSTAPLQFDVATFLYLTAPFAGATALIISQAHARMPASTTQLLQDGKATIFYTTASALVQIIERGAVEKRDLRALRWVKFCGEPMNPSQLVRAMTALPGAWFSNSYGPAEVNQCTFHHIAPGTPPDRYQSHIPIGQAWPAAQCILIDAEGEVPPGEDGELAVCAPTMMQGYWQRPDLEKHIYHTDQTGRVFYRTGDIARRDEQDGYVYLGRRDRQVKVRGYRVELDEIEAVLADHPDVIEAASFIGVVDGETMIGAAVLPRTETHIDYTTLMMYVRSKLPGYAIPRKLEIRDFFPRTTGGKIDRRKLGELFLEDNL